MSQTVIRTHGVLIAYFSLLLSAALVLVTYIDLLTLAEIVDPLWLLPNSIVVLLATGQLATRVIRTTWSSLADTDASLFIATAIVAGTIAAAGDLLARALQPIAARVELPHWPVYLLPVAILLLLPLPRRRPRSR